MEFTYRAIDSNGKVVVGSIESASRQEALQNLQDKGFTVLEFKEISEALLEEKRKKGLAAINISLEFGVSQKTLVFFTRQFASTLRAGLPILRCLKLLQRQTINKQLVEILDDIIGRIQQGEGLYEAMKHHSPPFSATYLSMVKVGEESGDLPKAMNKLADYLEKQYELKRKIKSAMSYPVFVLVFASVMVYLMIAYLLPTFTPIFKDSGLDIKNQYPVTQFLINLSDFVSQKWFLPVVIGIIVLIVVAIKLIKKNPKTKYQYDKIIFNMPFIQGFIHMQAFAIIASSLANLLASGVNLLEAINLVADTVDNLVVKEALNKLAEEIEKGSSISSAMVKVDIFPILMIQMVSVGEETGEIDKEFEHIAKFYDGELENSLNALTSLIEPFLMVGVGIAVFFFVIGIFLPIMGISQAYQQHM